MTQSLALNLQALASVQPMLCERVHWPVEGDHLRLAASGDWILRYRGIEVPAVLTELEISRACEAVDPNSRSTIFLFGLGLGELLKALMQRSPGAKFIVWERDPWLLRQALSLHDWSQDLLDNRLRFAMNGDLGPMVQSGLQDTVVLHPLLARLYTNELSLIRSGVLPKRALVCCGSLFVDSLADHLRAEGYSVMSFDMERISQEESDLLIRTWDPAIVMSINCKDGLAEFCEERGVHSVCWEIDPAMTHPARLQGPVPHSHIFTYRKKSTKDFESAGYRNISYLPLAADETKRKPTVLEPEQLQRYGCKVSFVGASLMENFEEFRLAFVRQYQAWKGATAPQAETLMRKVVRMQQSDLSQYSIPEHLSSLCPGFREHSIDMGHPDPIQYLAEISAAEKRLNYMIALAPHGPVAWGDAGWKRVEPHGVRYMGSALHETELPLIYNGSAINVDIGRLYQSDIVTMRVFDIMACGGFVLAEHSEALAELFEVGTEVESYRTLNELMSKVDHFLKHPEQAQAIAMRGREAVLQRHTIRSRVAHMLNAVAASAKPLAA